MGYLVRFAERAGRYPGDVFLGVPLSGCRAEWPTFLAVLRCFWSPQSSHCVSPIFHAAALQNALFLGKAQVHGQTIITVYNDTMIAVEAVVDRSHLGNEDCLFMVSCPTHWVFWLIVFPTTKNDISLLRII